MATLWLQEMLPRKGIATYITEVSFDNISVFCCKRCFPVRGLRLCGKMESMEETLDPITLEKARKALYYFWVAYKGGESLTPEEREEAMNSSLRGLYIPGLVGLAEDLGLDKMTLDEIEEYVRELYRKNAPTYIESRGEPEILTPEEVKEFYRKTWGIALEEEDRR